jgi:hypothetical protein
MTFHNTLLGRCATAYEERHANLGLLDDEVALCVAAVLEHLAAEITVLHQAEPRLSLHEFARLLVREAASVEPEPIEPPDDWNNHLSLTAEERNPTLR